MSEYAIHPEAFADLDGIWEYIAADNIDAADRVLADIYSTLTTLAASPRMNRPRARGGQTFSLPCMEPRPRLS